MFEAFKVGVTVALTNQVSKGLNLIGRDLLATERHLKSIQREFNRTGSSSLAVQKRITAASGAVAALNANLAQTKRLAVGGVLLGATGYAGLKAVGATVRPAEAYVHQLELAKAAGLSQLEIAKATGAAWKTTGDVLTTTATDNLKAVRELRMVFGDTGHAVAFLPQMQKIQAVLDSTLHGVGGVGAKDVAFTAAKALELRGASTDPATFQAQADLIVKGVIASGGRFTPAMLLQAQKYGGIGATGYSNDFLYGIMPTLVQEMGGSSTGTALTSMYRALVGGRVDKKALGVWQSLGLVDSVSGVTGETAMVRAKNAQLFQQSPFAYMQYLQAQMAAKGVTDPAAQQQLIERLFSNRTAGRMANVMAMQGPRLEKDFHLIGQAGTAGEYDRLVKTDPVMARQAAAAQWENLKTVIGLEVVPVLIPAIHDFAVGLHALSDWARAHPGTTKALVLGFTALSGALLFSGSVLLLKSAFLGLQTVFTLTGAASLTGGIVAFAGSAAAAASVLGAAALTLGVIAYHKEIAGAIDGTSWGQKLGDGLMGARDWLASGDDLSGARRVGPPPGGGKSQPIHTTVNIDGRKVASAVTSHQETAMNRPASSTGYFDVGTSMASPSATFAY